MHSIIVSADRCHIEIERFEVSRLPKYIWLETLEHRRLASNKKQRWIAYFYRRGFFDKDGKVWYQPTGGKYSSQTSRLIALPGKLLHRRKKRRILREMLKVPKIEERTDRERP